MCFLYKYAVSNVRNNFFLIFGLFLGVALSSFMSEIIQNKCIFTTESEQSSKYEQIKVINHDDFEPVINLAGKPLKAQKTPQDFQRPRYYRTELGIKDKVLAAILTSPKSIKNYGVTFNVTTNHLFDKMIFFMESEPNRSKGEVRWNGVIQFSDSRLVLKPFHMLKYIADNFVDDFDYFFLIRDNTYVRARELYNLIQRISISEVVHLGTIMQDGINFCSLNSGILLSNVILKKVSLKLDWCVKNALLESDDNNLGRCIVHSSGKNCTNSVQGLTFSSFKLNENVWETDIEKFMNTAAFKTALTFWPATNPNILLELHAHFAKADLLKRKLQISLIRNEIIKQPVVLPDNTTVKISWPVGNQSPFKPNNRFDLLRWDYFNENQIFLKSDFSNMDDLNGADLVDIKNIINISVEFLVKKYSEKLCYKRLLNGYRRFDPSRGMDYILDLAFTNLNTGREMHKRVEICKPLGKVELIPMPYVTENTRVNIVVLVDEINRKNILKFMENYVAVCMEKKDKTFLLLVLTYGAQHPGKGSKDDIFAEVKKMALKHSERFKKTNSKIAWLSVKLPDEDLIKSATFPEDKVISLNQGILQIALLDLAIKKFSADNLILFSTSNMEIRQDYLNRVRMNTIKDHQVFSPIPFSEFDPDIVYNDDLLRPKEMDINRNYGHYDTLNTDHISFYIKNYREARKTVEDFIPLIHTDKDLAEVIYYFKKKMEKMKRGKEKYSDGDKMHETEDPFIGNITKLSLNSVFSMFVGYGNFNILRAIEPGLRLRHVVRDCHRILNQNDWLRRSLYEQCVENRNFNSGSRSQLGHFILEFMRGCSRIG